jgi:hypothetical protein
MSLVRERKRMSVQRLHIVVSSVAVVLGLIANPLRAQPDGTSKRNFSPMTVLKRSIRPIVDAPLVAAAEAEDLVSDNELVLGVMIGDEARAYPINMLTGPQREIINDELGGIAIAATW